MRRIALIASTVLVALVCALLPSGALAHGHHRGHHHARRARHQGRRLHAGLFGASDGGSPQQSGGATTGRSAPTENVGPTQGSPEGNAGTVVSFTEGVLTIKLGEGEKATTVSGKVDEETELHCIPAPATTSTTAHAADEGDWSDGEQGQQSGDEQGQQSDDEQGQQSGDESGMNPDDNEGSGDDDGAEAGEQGQCTSANLTPGTVVHRAELQLDADGAIFREIVLVA